MRVLSLTFQLHLRLDLNVTSFHLVRINCYCVSNDQLTIKIHLLTLAENHFRTVLNPVNVRLPVQQYFL